MPVMPRHGFFASLLALGASGTAAALADEQPMRPATEIAFASEARSGHFRHYEVFSARRVSNGDVLAFMGNALNGYQFGWEEGAGTFHPAAVLYGTASTIALDDWAWDEYRLRELLARLGDPVTIATHPSGNPFSRPTSALRLDDDPNNEEGFYHDRSIVALRKRGAAFYACNNAVRLIAKQLIATHQTDETDIGKLHATLRSHLVQGATLVPAGVIAVSALQEKGYTLFPAS
ncbi:MAG: hypothetical protein JO101_01950 [Candidatus Eremiobacteraeota bacterium]|nr:hypothetical protein [Candidatus Eremiobacteraeota bacterium]